MSPPSMPGGGAGKDSTFSKIIDGKLPAKWVENQPSSPVVCFHNRLKWARVMLLIVPRDYMTQEQLWQGDVLLSAMQMAVQVGNQHCPEGFRIISNFGSGAHQSQLHAHIHVVSGLAKNIEEAQPVGEWRQHGRVRIRQYNVESAPHAELYVVDPSVDTFRLQRTQHDFLTSEGVQLAAEAAIWHAKKSSPTGFRLKANYTSAARNTSRGGDPGLFMLGGGQLSLYV